jgi:hypothetical protein
MEDKPVLMNIFCAFRSTFFHEGVGILVHDAMRKIVTSTGSFLKRSDFVVSGPKPSPERPAA